jgi:DNA-binding PadR family transcriptional regulator
MRIALMDIKVGTKINCKFTAVNMRNMLLLQKELAADFYYSTAQLINNKKQYDVFIFGFASVNGEIEKQYEFIKNSPDAKIFRLVGEYEQSGHPTLYYVLTRLNKKHFIITNVDEEFKSYKKYKIGQKFLNINLLVSRQSNELTTKKYDCIYYGRWRENRSGYFKKYIQNKIYLSTSIKNMKKFKHEGCTPKYLNTISWEERKETLNNFRYSLYIEDEYTHTVFNNLANRWYEAGICNNVVFFDINCWNTIKKSEIGCFENQIKDYIVSDYDSLKKKIDYCNQDFEKHLAIQKTWRLSESLLRKQLIDDIKSIIHNATIRP